jgi:protein TonB
MLEKKSSKGNLDKRKTTFFVIGLAIALGLVYAGFEFFASKPKDLGILPGIDIVEVFIDVPDTDPAKPPPPPPPAPQLVILIPTEKCFFDDTDLEKLFGPDFGEGDIIPEYEFIDIIGEKVDPKPEPVPWPDELPEPADGWESMYGFLKSTLKYPEPARRADISGTVLVEFVVETDGSISNEKIKSGVHPELDKEALRVVKLLPKWKPGKVNKKAVRCYFQIPIRFSLN